MYMRCSACARDSVVLAARRSQACHCGYSMLPRGRCSSTAGIGSPKVSNC